MAEVTVFVDDAVRGHLPAICAKDGVPADGRLRVSEEIGRSNRLGILWLLLLLGPIGWIVLVFLMSSDVGEQLKVELPFSDPAYDRIVEARRLRRWAVAIGAFGGFGLLVLTALLRLGPIGLVLTFALIIAAIAGALVAEHRLGQASVGVSLDGSRRWVTLSGVHPVFAAACQEQTANERR